MIDIHTTHLKYENFYYAVVPNVFHPFISKCPCSDGIDAEQLNSPVGYGQDNPKIAKKGHLISAITTKTRNVVVGQSALMFPFNFSVFVHDRSTAGLSIIILTCLQ